MLSEQLKAFIGAAQARPMVWGYDDCTGWPSLWVEQITARPLPRPVYSSRDEAMAIIAEHGSLARLWANVLCGVLDETGIPEIGDIGVIDTGRAGHVGGIFMHGGFFAWRGETRVAPILPRTIIRVWSIQ
ncbi:DUF6950 family protein [Rhizobium mongolense]|uniref:DUF6950 domain-containing protein n=1 Tax=Rhizobium mongolense TaxID=57676 RepID=A0A7W6RRY2_9HYPH|nr:hypothetical protein [Rhizobium mongolense]MBB4277021.1 hypothetical protein [Rhizobium mongolense]